MDIFVTGGDQQDFIGLTSSLVFDSVTAFLGARNDRLEINAANGETVELNVDLGSGEGDDAFLLVFCPYLQLGLWGSENSLRIEATKEGCHEEEVCGSPHG